MNRQLAAVVIASFRDADTAQCRQQLSRFSARQWQHNFSWLDASGAALYFLDRLRALEADDAIPDSVLAQLEQRHADNEQRTSFLIEEFARINAAFRNAGMEYANLKGFTLVPGYCPDPSLRCQMDFDFLMSERQAQQCQDLLRSLGYSLMASNTQVMEFKSHAGSVPHVKDLYKAKPQHSVEVHLCDDSRFEFQSSLLESSVAVTVDGAPYPALAPEDMFLSQASHIFRHIRSEWTRVSWLLELRHFVLFRREDAAFWREVQARAAIAPGAAVAIGAALMLTEKAFGNFVPDELRDWTVATLPVPVARWITRFGDEVLLADFPGSKLYLILERELDDSQQTSSKIRRRLLPLRGPARVTAAAAVGVGERFKALRFQWRYFFFRLRFHAAQTPRYLWEAWRWNGLSHSSSGTDEQLLQAAPPAGSSECQAGQRLHTSYPSLTVKQQ